jgi:hypothetical protein
MTTTPVTDPTVLTRDDIAAMNAADDVSFHHNPEDNGPGSIRLYRRSLLVTDRIWTAREQRLFPETHTSAERVRTLANLHSAMSGYAQPDTSTTAWNNTTEPLADAFTTTGGCSYNDDWRTIVGLLRPGQRLALKWTADNNTENIRWAKMHADELRLLVYRPHHAWPRSFLIQARVAPDNSARMIRRYGR